MANQQVVQNANILLKKAFQTYTKLLSIEYIFRIKSIPNFDKKVYTELSITFSKAKFYHLTGLQHITDVYSAHKYDILQAAKNQFYLDVESGAFEITNEIVESSFFTEYEIEKRLALVSKLEKLLDESTTLYEYDGFLYVFNKLTNEWKPYPSVKEGYFVYNLNNRYQELAFFVENKTVEINNLSDRIIKTIYCEPCSSFPSLKDYTKKQIKISFYYYKKYQSTEESITLHIEPGYFIHQPDKLDKEIDYFKRHPECLDKILKHIKVTDDIKDRVLEIKESLKKQ